MLFRYKPDIFTDIPGIKHYFPQAVPVVLKLCRMAGIAGTVDRMMNWNESNAKISPGLVIESLATCIMCNRKPLWRVQEFWAVQARERLQRTYLSPHIVMLSWNAFNGAEEKKCQRCNLSCISQTISSTVFVLI